MIEGYTQRLVMQRGRRLNAPWRSLTRFIRKPPVGLNLLCLVALLFPSGCGTQYGAAPGTDTSSKYGVQLMWNAPGGSDPAVSYNVYRELTAGTVGFQQINTSPVTALTYTDKGVQLGTSYTYVVRALDAEGGESDPSNTATVVVPSQ